jgi:hypothetical protein
MAQGRVEEGGMSERIADVAKWTDSERAFITLLECYLYGTRDEFEQAEKAYWKTVDGEAA